MKNIEKGRKAEALAIEYLQSKGYEIITQNYRYKKAEIDLIVKKENFIVFVEVKYRTSVSYGLPEEMVGKEQSQRIIQAADYYLFSTNTSHNPRFDIVAITEQILGQTQILHLEDAFY